MRPAIPVGGDVGGHGNDNKRSDSGWVCSFYRLLVFAAFTMRRIYLPKERQAQRPARNSTAAAQDGYIRMGAWNDLQHGQPSWAPADASLRTSQYQHGPVAAHGRPVAAPNEGRRCFFSFFFFLQPRGFTSSSPRFAGFTAPFLPPLRSTHRPEGFL